MGGEWGSVFQNGNGRVLSWAAGNIAFEPLEIPGNVVVVGPYLVLD